VCDSHFGIDQALLAQQNTTYSSTQTQSFTYLTIELPADDSTYKVNITFTDQTKGLTRVCNQLSTFSDAQYGLLNRTAL
jgi:hypothetical protein